jgi:hypothetical protein
VDGDLDAEFFQVREKFPALRVFSRRAYYFNDPIRG